MLQVQDCIAIRNQFFTFGCHSIFSSTLCRPSEASHARGPLALQDRELLHQHLADLGVEHVEHLEMERDAAADAWRPPKERSFRCLVSTFVFG